MSEEKYGSDYYNNNQNNNRNDNGQNYNNQNYEDLNYSDRNYNNQNYEDLDYSYRNYNNQNYLNNRQQYYSGQPAEYEDKPKKHNKTKIVIIVICILILITAAVTIVLLKYFNDRSKTPQYAYKSFLEELQEDPKGYFSGVNQLKKCDFSDLDISSDEFSIVDTDGDSVPELIINITSTGVGNSFAIIYDWSESDGVQIRNVIHSDPEFCSGNIVVTSSGNDTYVYRLDTKEKNYKFYVSWSETDSGTYTVNKYTDGEYDGSYDFTQEKLDTLIESVIGDAEKLVIDYNRITLKNIDKISKNDGVSAEYKDSKKKSEDEPVATTSRIDEEEFDDYLFAEEDEYTQSERTDEYLFADDEPEKSVKNKDGGVVTTKPAVTTRNSVTTASPEDDPSTWTTEEIVAYYNTARKNTSENIKSHQTMALSGDISGDGAIGTILKVLQPAAEKALSNNSKDLTGVPAQDHPDIKVSDVKKAVAKKDANGNIVITMQFNDQKDGSDGDDQDGGPVSRGIGTLGSIDSALSELGATLTSGRDTVTLTYTSAYIKDCVINPKTQTITSGTYHYLVKVFIGDAQAKLGITAHLENLQAAIDYTRTVG